MGCRQHRRLWLHRMGDAHDRPARPSDPAWRRGFEPVLTALSLIMVISGIGAGVWLSLGERAGRAVLQPGRSSAQHRSPALCRAGLLSDNRAGRVDIPLVSISILVGLVLSGAALVAAGERGRTWRRCAAPLLLASITILHLGGMTAMTLIYDPRILLPDTAIGRGTIAPIIAAVSLGLLMLAFIGLRMTLNARAQMRRDGSACANSPALRSKDSRSATMARSPPPTAASSPVGPFQAELVGCSIARLLPGLVLADLPEQEERDTKLVDAAGHGVPVRVLRKDIAIGHRRQTVVAFRDQRSA